jgi:plasmid rolling circle replication initiator protein Rep
MGRQKETPGEVIGQDTSSTGAKTEDFHKRLNRYSQGKRNALQIQKYLLEQIEKDKFQGKQKRKVMKSAERLSCCGNFLKFWNYYTVGEYKLKQAYFCKQHLLCQLCAMRRGAKQAREAAEKVAYLLRKDPDLKASLATLTVKDGPDLGERVGHLIDGKKKIIYTMQNAKKRKKIVSEFAKIQGIIGAVEITRGKGSKLWHPHIHAIILHRGDFLPLRDGQGRTVTLWDARRKVRVPQLALAEEWQRMTGDSFILDVSPIKARSQEDMIKNCCEVFKYALKFSSMGVVDVVNAWLLLSGRQLVFSAGLLRGLEKDPLDLLDDIPIDYDDLPYLEIMYRYVHGAGYSLEYTKKSETGEMLK